MPVDESRSDRFRLVAAGHVLQPKDCSCRNLPFVIRRGDLPLYLQQRSLSSEGPREGAVRLYPLRRPALRDSERLAS